MKKFFLCLIILLAFGGFVFWTGWTQIKLKKNHYGIVVSKLGGIHSSPVLKGKFNFNKAFLIPSNAELIQFSDEPFFAEKTISGSLMSSDLYSDQEKNLDFSYEFSFQMELHCTPQDVVNLMGEKLITDEQSLFKYLDVTAQAICQECASFYLTKSREASISSELFFPEAYSIVDIFKWTHLYDKYPFVQIDVISLKDSKIPDYKLYEKVREKLINEN